MAQLLTILLLTIVSYTKSLVQVPVAHGDTVSGYLLVPDEVAPAPAILALHDHGAYFTIGKEKLTPPVLPSGGREKMEEAQRWVDKFYEGQFVADTLASRGYVVLVIDALYWGERQPLSPSPSSLRNDHSGLSSIQNASLRARGDIDSLKLLNKRLKNEQPEFYQRYFNETGEPWFERILADDKACVDYLMSLPYVDKERIGVWGFSMGAYRAWQLAAEDKRVAFCAAANWMQAVPETRSVTETKNDAAQSWQLVNVSSWSMYRPSKDSVSYAEIVSQIAPRPMLLQYGLQDKLFPEPVLKEGQWPALTIQAIDSEHRFTKEHMRLLLEWLYVNM